MICYSQIFRQYIGVCVSFKNKRKKCVISLNLRGDISNFLKPHERYV